MEFNYKNFYRLFTRLKYQKRLNIPENRWLEIYLKHRFKIFYSQQDWENYFKVLIKNYQYWNKPICKHNQIKTLGEEIIFDILKQNNIHLYSEVYLNPKKKRYSLRFDFYGIFKGRKVAIEYDGKQHFFMNENKENSRVDFIHQIRNDKIKDVWCKVNDVYLLRIPFTKINKIESCLVNFLIKVCNMDPFIEMCDEKLYKNRDNFIWN